VDGEEVLRKIRQFDLTSWNYIGQDAKTLRHYGPMAQEFFAAFGQDGIGQIHMRRRSTQATYWGY